MKRVSGHEGHYTQWRCPFSANPGLICARPCFYRTRVPFLPKDPRLLTHISKRTNSLGGAMDTRTAAERLFGHLKCGLGPGDVGVAQTPSGST